VHAVVQDAIAHGELPFEKVVDAVRPPRDPARSPLFQISFGLPNSGEPLQLPGVRAVPEHFDLDSSRFDMSWNLNEAPEALDVQVEFNTELFDRQTIETLVRSYEQVLRAALSDIDAPISRLPLLTAAERDELLHRWNGPERPVQPVTIPELFQQRVRQDPGAVALVVGGEQITYDALNRRANQLARLLAERGDDVTLDLLAVGLQRAGPAVAPLGGPDPLVDELRQRHGLAGERVRISLGEELPEVLLGPTLGLPGRLAHDAAPVRAGHRRVPAATLPEEHRPLGVRPLGLLLGATVAHAFPD
jgi:non-ribosomal peptide synthetase component F